MEAIFIQMDRVLLHSLMEAVDNINAGIGNGNVPCSALELQNVRMMEILQELCLIQYFNNEAIPTPVFDSEFWETQDLSSLSVMIVPNGVYIFRRDDFGSVIEHQQMISNANQYARYMEEMFIAGNVVALEASDPAQDWISQEMIKPHVITIREMLKFTDVQIKNGLENLHRRGEEINFLNLLDALILTEDAVVNVYVGTRKYAFSADVKLVLHECFDKYQREPTMEEFDQEWNRIKEHLINLLDIERTRAEQADTRAEQADTRAIRAHRERIEAMRQINTAMEDRNEAQEMMNAAIEEIIQAKDREESLEEEKRRAEEEIVQRIQKEAMLQEEKRRAEEEIVQRIQKEAMLQEEKRRAEEEKRRAEEEIVQRIQKEAMLQEEKRRAEEEIVQRIQKEAMLQEEKRRAEEEKRRAEEEKRRAEEEKRRAEEEKRRAEEEKRRAEEEIVQRIQKEAMLEEEKRRVEEMLLREKMREQIRAEILEHEKRKLEEEKLLMAAKFEEEKRILLSRIQQISGCAQA
ncbi:vicilin-like seed storage protein At2g18540 isoform X2 [Pecten maximus]|uniref:vicilin-like seed storage protein At2g18540 isoform X2 n=1 Tax=Pecten maximus TaxID=6579 RepID=UPI001459112C|nr:vicilin-like seed storage protein At2g18540 isoform X2 [Pecten maximus]